MIGIASQNRLRTLLRVYTPSDWPGKSDIPCGPNLSNHDWYVAEKDVLSDPRGNLVKWKFACYHCTATSHNRRILEKLQRAIPELEPN